MSQIPRFSDPSWAGWVYFIHDCDRDLIKIGVSSEPEGRLKALQTANGGRLELLGCVPGGRTLERILHRHYSDLRQEGEWFTADKRLLVDIGGFLSDAEHQPDPAISEEVRMIREQAVDQLKELALAAVRIAEAVAERIDQLETPSSKRRQ